MGGCLIVRCAMGKKDIICSAENYPDPKSGYTLRMEYMYEDSICTIIDVDFLMEKIEIANFTDNIMHRAFGVLGHPTWEDFQWFLSDRVFPPTRGDAREILRFLGLQSYDPLQIIEKTEGCITDDSMWIRFKYYERRGRHVG